MAKPTKTREELIKEANSAVDLTKDVDENQLDPTEQPDAPLPPEAQKEADRIAGLTEEQVLDEVPAPDPKYVAAEEAAKMLRTILGGYAPTAPNEHICFGNGAGKFTLGHLRALCAVIPPQ